MQSPAAARKVIPNQMGLLPTYASLQRDHVEQLQILTPAIDGTVHAIYIPIAEAHDLEMFDKDKLGRLGIVGVDGSNYGAAATESSDMGVALDLNTGFIDPFIKGVRTATFLGNLKNADRSDSAFDSRTILKNANASFTALQLGTFVASCEMEFYLGFVDPTKKDAYQLTAKPRDTYYHLPFSDDPHATVRSQMAAMMISLGLPVKYHHTEVGGMTDGTIQNEIEFNLVPIEQLGDAYIVARYIIDAVAKKYGRSVEFSPKPFADIAGSGLHTHMYVRDAGKSMFYSPEGNLKINRLGLGFAAGILRHGRALAAFTNPTPASYDRLDPHFEAPIHLFLGQGNRTAAIRIPKYTVTKRMGPKEGRFEYRPTDTGDGVVTIPNHNSGNPQRVSVRGNYHLILSGFLLAGMDGLRRKWDPFNLGMGPNQPDRWKALPTSISEAAAALDADNTFLTENGIFPQEVVTRQASWLRKILSDDQIAVLLSPAVKPSQTEDPELPPLLGSDPEWIALQSLTGGEGTVASLSTMLQTQKEAARHGRS